MTKGGLKKNRKQIRCPSSCSKHSNIVIKKATTRKMKLRRAKSRSELSVKPNTDNTPLISILSIILTIVTMIILLKICSDNFVKAFELKYSNEKLNIITSLQYLTTIGLVGIFHALCYIRGRQMDGKSVNKWILPILKVYTILQRKDTKRVVIAEKSEPKQLIIKINSITKIQIIKRSINIKRITT